MAESTTRHVVVYSGPDYREPTFHPRVIKIHDRTVCALEALSAAHILGQGVLVDTQSDSTAMVSIAEAASTLLGKSLSEFLWILLKFIERELKAERASTGRKYCIMRWEIDPHCSPEAHFSDPHDRHVYGETGMVQGLANTPTTAATRLIDAVKTTGESRKASPKIPGVLMWMSRMRGEQKSRELMEMLVKRREADRMMWKTAFEKVERLEFHAESTQILRLSEENKGNYASGHSVLRLRKVDEEWTILLQDGFLESDIRLSIDWLEVALGDAHPTPFSRSLASGDPDASRKSTRRPIRCQLEVVGEER
jgi:hypothetical protein